MKRMLLTAMWCGMATIAFAGTRYTWQGGTETHYWSEPGMWITDTEPTGVEGVPNGEDEVRIWGTGTTVITNGDVISTQVASLRYDQVLHMQGGTWTNLGTGDHFFVPWHGGKGTIVVDDGLLRIKGNMHLGYVADTAGLGMIKQYGGNIVVDKWASIGRHTSTTGLARHVGGTMSGLGASHGYVVGEQGVGRLEVGGTGTVSVGGSYGIWFYNRAEGACGAADLSTGGMLTTKKFSVGNNTGYLGTGCTFTFDGGTLKTAEDRAAFITVGGTQTATSLTAFDVTSRGGTVDTDGHAVTFNQALTAADAVAPLNLVHRWSFNGDARDSVGGTVGTLDGTASLAALPGSVKLPGGAHGAGAVDLGPNLLPTGGAGFTVELWGTLDTLSTWARCIEIGSKSDNTVNSDYLFCGWTRGANNDYGPVLGICYPGTRYLPASTAAYTIGIPYHIALTAEPVGDGTWSIKYWRQVAGSGKIETVITQSAPSGWNPAVQNADHFWLGRSLAAADADTAASYDEVRVWDRPLTEWELVMNDFAGSDAVIGEEPFVKTGTGTLTLTGANTYTVSTEVEGGTLALAAGASMVSDVLVKTGGVFAVAATATPPSVAFEVGENGACGYVTPVSGTLDLGSLSLSIANPEALSAGCPYVICRSAGGFSGILSTAALPSGWRATIDSIRGEIRLVKVGMTIIFR
jgi:autotransporter-associated beta strand protein